MYTLPKGISQYEMQTASFKIWTQVAMSISCNSMCASLKANIWVKIDMKICGS